MSFDVRPLGRRKFPVVVCVQSNSILAIDHGIQSAGLRSTAETPIHPYPAKRWRSIRRARVNRVSAVRSGTPSTDAISA